MIDDDMTPLPDDVAAALVAERARSGADAATRARLRARVQASVGNVAGAGPSPADASRGASAPQTLLERLRLVHPVLTGVVGLAVGVAVGAAIQARLDGARPRIMEAAPAPPPERSPASSSAPAVDVPAATASARDDALAPGAARSSEAATAPAPSAPTLTAERALLDIAHTALANGRAAAALDALGRHAQRFPRGVYREEREALTIQSLHALGRTDEAERRASAFKTRYPRSLFLATVEEGPLPNP